MNKSIENFGNLELCCIKNTLMIKENNKVIKNVVSTDTEFLEEEKLEFFETLSRHSENMDNLELKIIQYVSGLQ